MALSRSTSRIVTLSLLSVLLALVAYDKRLAPSPLAGKIFYNCYSCDTTKGECKLELIHEKEEIGSPCAALGLGTSCAQACKCPSGTWPCEVNSCVATFVDLKNWLAYQPNSAEGFLGSVFDGERYLYYVPNKNDNGPHGVVWRYDTLAALNSQPSWGSFDPSSNGLSAAARGFAGGAFDGRYVYFAPSANAAGPSGAVMRYDTTKNMGAVASWELYDPSEGGLGVAAKGFNGAVFDGRYVYFVPDTNASGAHNDVLRYDVTKPFTSVASWQIFDPKSSASAKKGYAGAIFDGRYVYFIPKGPTPALANASGKLSVTTSAAQGEMLRYDTRAPFATASSWTTFDPSGSGVGTNARGYNGATFDGTFIYLAPYVNNSGPQGEFLRYNTKQSFTAASSWTSFNLPASGLDADAKGYIGAAFDGQFVYFSPAFNSKEFHGKFVRYNVKGAFTDKTSWTVFDLTKANGSSSSANTSAKTNRNYVLYTSPDPISWQDAEKACVARRGHLATITSKDDNDAAYNKLKGATNVWIGLNDLEKEGDYRWTSGEPFGESFWFPGQPNGTSIPSNNCVFMNHDSIPPSGSLWHDVECAGTSPYVVQAYLCEIPTAGSSASSGTASGPTLSASGPNGETMAADGSITVPSGGSVTFTYNCAAQIPVPPGYMTNGITCDLTNGAGQSLFIGNTDARWRNVGGYSFPVSQAQTFTFSCGYTLYNSISSYTTSVCSFSVPVKMK